MKTRAAFALVALVTLVTIAGRTQAGGVDKAKLRELAHLPDISISFGFTFSSISGGFRFGENPDHLAEIARLQKQMKGDPSDAERYLLLGQHYSMEKCEKEAKEAFRKAVAICRQQVREHPSDVRWLIQLGETLFSSGESNEGEDLLRRAVKEAPKEWRGWLALAKCVDSRSAWSLFGDKRLSLYFRSQEQMLSMLMEHKPTEQQITETRRLWKEARCYYDRAVELAPHDEAKPHLHRRSSNHYQGFIDLALHKIQGENVNPEVAVFAPECLADMRQIARLSPADPQTIGSALICDIVACVYQDKLERKEDCSSRSERLAARDPSLVDVLPAESRKSVRWCIERLEQLTKHSNKATAATASEIMADGMFAIRSISEALDICGPSSVKKRDSREKELEYLRRAIRLDPSRERAWDLLTMQLVWTKKDIDDAIAVARKRITIKDNAHNRFLLANAYAQGNQFEKAAQELNAGLKSNPKDLSCLLGLIALELRRGDAQSLQEAGEQLEVIAPRITEEKSEKHGRDYLLLKGIHSALTDHPDQARAEFRQVLQMKKDEPTATRALAALDGH